MKTSRFPSTSISNRLLVTVRVLTAPFAICRHAAARWRPLEAMLLSITLLCVSIASAQTAHLSQTQTVLNIPSPLGYGMGLAIDLNGNMYIADEGEARVLKLTPSNGGFIQTTIGTGFQAVYGIAVDASGNLYIADNLQPTLIKETPNGSGGYAQSTIGNDLYNVTSVAVDSHGNVFGVANGEMFKETFSGGVYIQSYLPTPGAHGVYQLVVDSNGDLLLNGYGSEMYEEIPLPGGGGYSTNPLPFAGGNSIALDANNNLYIANYPGTIYKMTPNGIASFTTTASIYTDSSFNDNDWYAMNYGVDYFDAVGLTVDGNGNVFFIDGYTQELIEESASPQSIGQIPVTGTSYPIAMFFTFDTGGIMGSYSILTDGVPNTEFTDSYLGTCHQGGNYSAGSFCDIDVNFTPAAPGTRSGAVVLNNSTADPFLTSYVQGIGVSPLVGFEGAAPAPYVTGLTAPLGLTVDAAGNAIVANSGTNNVLLVAPGGAQSQIGSGFDHPSGVAEDGAGNIFVAQSGIVYEVAKTTGVQTQLNLSGVTNPTDLAMDGAGNLYISEPSLGTVVKVTPTGAQSTVGSGLSGPRGIAVDAGGNVYIADNISGDVSVVTPLGAQSTISGFVAPTGVAVDAAGNVYVADYGGGELVEVAPGGAQTILASGLSYPYSVALDGSGNIYFSQYGADEVTKIDRADAPSLNFMTTDEGSVSADSPRTVTLENTGNAALDFPGISSSINPAISTGFTLNSSSASDCPLVPANSSTPGSLPAGASCLLPISFEPLAPGSNSGTLAITDNNLNAAAPGYAVQSISLSGTGTPGPATMTSPTPGTQLSGSSVTFSWSAGGGVTQYEFRLGTTVPGSSDVYNSADAATTSLTTGLVSGIPTYGVTLYARLYSKINGVWQWHDYTYTESGTPVPAVLIIPPSPTPKSTLTGSSATFSWSAGVGVTQYEFRLGTTGPGSSDVYNPAEAVTTSLTTGLVSGIPTNGVTLYARLYSKINGAWQYIDYTYTESGTPVPAALITPPSPTPESTLTGSSATFSWSAGVGVTQYEFRLGTTVPGSSDVYNSADAATTSLTTGLVSGIPTNGVTLYARLYSKINGAWQYIDYTYTEAP